MKISMILGLLLMFITLSGCNNELSNKKQGLAQQGSYTVVDDTGREIFLSGKPQRIISLTYGTDEILNELVDPKRIVAFSRWAGDSEISFVTKEQASIVKHKVFENTEAIFALKPDLIVASVATAKEVVATLEAMGLPIYIAQSPKDYPQMCNKILGIAALVGEEAQGKKLVERMDERLNVLKKKLAVIPAHKQKIVVAFNFTSAMGRKGELFDHMLETAKVINGAALLQNDKFNSVISKEQVVAVNPDIFLLPTWNYDNKRNIEGYTQEVMNDPAYKNVTAVQKQQLKFVADKYRYVASQYIVDAIENIARVVYPEIFEGDHKCL